MTRLLLSAALAVPLVALAADPPKPGKVVIADPAKLKDDLDYAVQGEYEGEVDSSGKKPFGIHVVARGGGKFDVVTYKDGLPGAGARTDSLRLGGTAERKDGKVLISGPQGNPAGEIRDGKFIIKTDYAAGTLSRVERKSPTLGMKPLEGAVVLFGGPDDVSKWENGKLTELSDGTFLAASGCRSKQLFTDFTAHVEFRLAYMPGHTGQARSNSGVYIQDRYELQVLDSFGLKGVDNECGGIYKESAPKVNMCLPPGVWQTYDIEFTAAKFDGEKKTAGAVVTVKHNGVVIHDKLNLKAATPGGKFAKEVPTPGALFFQNHGDPVVFRNVWVKETK